MLDFMILHLKWYDLSQSKKNKILNYFLNDNIKLIDAVSSDVENTTTLSLLAEKNFLIEKLIQLNLQHSMITKNHLYSIILNPLRIGDLKKTAEFIRENKKRLFNSIQRPVIHSGYLTNEKKPVYFRWHKPEFVFKGKIKWEQETIPMECNQFQNLPPVYFALSPYPIIIFIKVAIESAQVLQSLKERLEKFIKKKTSKKISVPLLQFSYTTNEAMTIGKIALKISDYKIFPVHNVMIFLYDQFEKINIVPVEAEFGLPVPMDIIQTAIDDLFSNLEAGITPSTEMIKTLTLFRFNIEEIFEYPSYILEKRFDLI
jgi:hypothetical protein